ncbi:MAG: hypothetical protein AAGB26_02120 [Planctomycetota bacterium]
MARQSGSSKFCLGCRYCLDHLESDECPECGRGFDPNDPKTFSNSPRRIILPRWESFAAAFLFSIFLYQSYAWREVQTILWNKRSLISWGNEYAYWLSRFEELLNAAFFVCLIPVFIVSAYRARPRCLVNVICCLIFTTAFLLWPGTRVWILDMLEVIPKIHQIDQYLESRAGQHP